MVLKEGAGISRSRTTSCSAIYLDIEIFSNGPWFKLMHIQAPIPPQNNAIKRVFLRHHVTTHHE